MFQKHVILWYLLYNREFLKRLQLLGSHFFFSLNVEKTRHNQPEIHVELYSSEKLC